MAAVGELRTNVQQPLMTCPACDNPIVAEAMVEFSPADEIAAKQVQLNGVVTGIRVDHNCLPGAKRGPGRPRGSVAKPKPVDAPEGLVETPEDRREVLKERAVRDNPQA